MIARLRAGEFGGVQRFLGLSLHAHILQRDPSRWEVNKKISGGGVLINSGGHVLSMILAAFGQPEDIEVESRHIHSVEVEDCQPTPRANSTQPSRVVGAVSDATRSYLSAESSKAYQ